MWYLHKMVYIQHSGAASIRGVHVYPDIMVHASLINRGRNYNGMCSLGALINGGLCGEAEDTSECSRIMWAIWNVDETPMYFDLPANKTLDFKGLKSVKVSSTGHEKLSQPLSTLLLLNRRSPVRKLLLGIQTKNKIGILQALRYTSTALIIEDLSVSAIIFLSLYLLIQLT